MKNTFIKWAIIAFLAINIGGWLIYGSKKNKPVAEPVATPEAGSCTNVVQTAPIPVQPPAVNDVKKEDAPKAPMYFRSIEAKVPSFGNASINVHFNRRLTDANLAQFFSVEPQVKFEATPLWGWYDNWEERTGDFYVSLTGNFEPGKTYKVSVKAGLASENGNKLPVAIERTVTISPRDPGIAFADGFDSGRYLAPYGDITIPVKVVNVTNLKVRAEHLLPQNVVQLAMRANDKYGHWYGWRDQHNLEYLTDKAIEADFPVKTPENAITAIPCNLAECFGKSARGVYLVTVEAESVEETISKLISASDLGISALFDREGTSKDGTSSVDVRITSLCGGHAQEGAEVSVYSDHNEFIGKAKSNKSGLAKIKIPKDMTPIAVVATLDGDVSFVEIDEKRECGGIVKSGRDYLLQGEVEAFLFTDRGVYRPGETAFVQALVRNSSAKAPKAFPLQLTLFRPNGRVDRTIALMPDARGAVKAEVMLGEDAAQGTYTAALHIPGKDGARIGTCKFGVESFVPPQIRVSVTPRSKSGNRGDNVTATISAEHLYGAPAEGLAADAAVSFVGENFRPEGWEHYSFGNPSVPLNYSTLSPTNGMILNVEGKGDITFNIPSDLAAPSRARAVVTATVHENSGRTVSAVGNVVVDLSPYYIGLFDGCFDDVPVGVEKDILWAAVNAEGAARAEASGLVATLEKIEHKWHCENNDGRNEWKCDTTMSDVFRDRKIQSADTNGRGSFKLCVSDYGEYVLTLTDRANGISASRKFYGGSLDSSAAGVMGSTIKIKTDKDQYTPGETATVHIAVPFTGELYVAVAKDKVLRSLTMSVTNRTVDISLPITAANAPSLNIFASIVRPVAPEENWGAHRAVGSTSFTVLPVENKLDVKVKSPEKIKPRAGVDVEVSVSSPTGAPLDDDKARVTVFAVDEGICMLTSYATPDPNGYFFSKRICDLDYYDSYQRLVRVTDKKLTGYMSHVGGDGDYEGFSLKKRLNPISARRFKPLALKVYDAAVVNGKAVVHFDLPEFTGQLRFTAVAWTDSATGSASASSSVHGDVTVQADMPRVLAPGDKSFISLTLDNTVSSSADLAICIQCIGPMSVTRVPGNFTIAGKTRKAFQIPVSADGGTGVATVRVSVTGDRTDFRDEMEIPVRPATSRFTLGESAVLNPGESKEFAPLPDVLDSSAEQTCNMLAFPACDIRAALAYLYTYPYGCLEQTTSGAFPFLNVTKLPQGYIEDGVLAGARMTIDRAIDRVLSMKLEGGFSMWPDSRTVSEFGTLYAVHFLAEAKKAGFGGDKINSMNLVAMLKNMLERDVYKSVNDRCYLALDLALLGECDRPLISQLASSKNELSVEARAMLAQACIACGDPASAKTLLVGVGKPVDLRDAAFLLTSLSALDPADARVAECLQTINKEKSKRSGHWETTQHNALALNAISTYIAVAGRGDADARIEAKLEVFGDKPDVVLFPAGRAYSWKSQGGQGNVPCRVTNTGKGMMYVSREQSAFPLSAKVPAASNGMKVKREYFNRDGVAADIGTVKRGGLVIVKITVESADTRDDIVVEDLLPACLEIENARLVGNPLYPWAKWEPGWVQHYEARDDRMVLFSGEVGAGEVYCWYYVARVVSAGEYIVPAIQASAMYDPAVYARGEAAHIKCEQ